MVTLFGLCRIVPSLPIGGYIIRCAVDKKLMKLPIYHVFSSVLSLLLINIYFYIFYPAALNDVFVFTFLGALAANYNICVGIYQSDIDKANTKQHVYYFIFLAFWSISIPTISNLLASDDYSAFLLFIFIATVCHWFSFYKVLKLDYLKTFFAHSSPLVSITVIAQLIYSIGTFAWISVDRLIVLKHGPELTFSADHYAIVSVVASVFAGITSTIIIASRSQFLKVARKSKVQMVCYAIGGVIITTSVATYFFAPSAIIAFPISVSLLGIVLSFLMIKALDTDHSMLLTGFVLLVVSALVFILLEYISLASGMLIILVAKFLLPLCVEKITLSLQSKS
ncbi:hypothetical protein ISG33_02385 [Glaciecola sp. MH2013]|uniref:hypothetical protein n=1 Tax=Glaciecola sp. MH2013 TaxID=2785524 RepID=UPI00189E3A28|nr:hypothetical protein [Glaciecola sp. MH2013]MBF7072249.1 hypothetical protein [Glaciecola sp. MH2013]